MRLRRVVSKCRPGLIIIGRVAARQDQDRAYDVLAAKRVRRQLRLSTPRTSRLSRWGVASSAALARARCDAQAQCWEVLGRQRWALGQFQLRSRATGTGGSAMSAGRVSAAAAHQEQTGHAKAADRGLAIRDSKVVSG